uniref:Renin receptor-like C-terminal transmembrane spanning segment domain-containing protein n=1 Tax=Caenorhabditis japonica TaxID=281687 RepID=A0A8R1HS97_CAEJA
MRNISLIFLILPVCLAGRLQIVLPDDHTFDKDLTTFNSESLFKFNRRAFGIAAEGTDGPAISGSQLFSKPKALIIISINGLDDFVYDGHSFNFTDVFHTRNIRENLQHHFGDDMIHVNVNSSGIFGSKHFTKSNADVGEMSMQLQDLKNMLELAKSIKEKDRRSANVVDFYRIHLDVSNAREKMEKKQLEENIKIAIDKLSEAFDQSYEKNNRVLEMYSHTEITEKEEFKKLKDVRKYYQVARPRNQEYPAMAAIFIFIVLGLLFALISALFLMFDDGEMSKNSLVYRLSTGRQKKD